MSGKELIISKTALEDGLAVALMRIIQRHLSGMPLKKSLQRARSWGILFAGFSKRLKVAEKNIRTAMPQLKINEVRRIAKEAYASFFISIAELLLMRNWSHDAFDQMIEFDNLDEVEKVLSDSRGTIFITGHFGNWELLNAMAGRYGKTLFALAKPLKHRKLEHFLNSLREQQGSSIIYRGSEMKRMISELKKGGLAGIVADQDSGTKGVFVNFMGRLTSCPRGVSRLAVMTNARILPVFLVRKDLGKYRFVLGEEIDYDSSADQLTLDKEIMQEFCSQYEKQIHLNPEQCLWQHKRWKTSPDRQVTVISDGKPGHEKQSLYLAAALSGVARRKGQNIKIRIIEVKLKAKNISTWMITALCRVFPAAGEWAIRTIYDEASAERILNTAADYIVSAGASTELANRHSSRLNFAKNCFIQAPQFGFTGFSSVVLPSYDRKKPAAKNAFISPGPLASPSGRVISGRKGAGILLGGKSKHMDWDTGALQSILNDVVEHYKKSQSPIFLTTSRRTPSDTTAMLKEQFESRIRATQGYFVLYGENDEGGADFQSIIDTAEECIVTADSLSMISEAAISIDKLLVLGFCPKEDLGYKIREFIKRHNIAYLDACSGTHAFKGCYPFRQSEYVQEMFDVTVSACQRMVS